MKKLLSTIKDFLFIKESSNYDSANQCIQRLKHKIEIDVVKNDKSNTEELEIVKNNWKKVSKNIANNVSVIGLHMCDNYQSNITYYKKCSITFPIKYAKTWKLIKVIEGCIIDLTNNIILKRGDMYIIPINSVHELKSCDDTYVYTLFTDDVRYLKISDSEDDLLNKVDEIVKPKKISS